MLSPESIGTMNRRGFLAAAGLMLAGTKSLGEEPARVSQTVTGTQATETASAVRHVFVQEQGTENGWKKVESANTEILHLKSTDFARIVATMVERVRETMQMQLCGSMHDWRPKCRVIVYPAPDDYIRANPRSSRISPGHSDFLFDHGRVIQSSIHINESLCRTLSDVLVHEGMHVTTEHLFGEPVPRWADEGLATLVESDEKREQHRKNFLSYFNPPVPVYSLRQMFAMKDYPAGQNGLFYAESVSVVRYLSLQKPLTTLVSFIKDGMRGGYEQAANRHYGYASLEDMDKAWTKAIHAGLC